MLLLRIYGVSGWRDRMKEGTDKIEATGGGCFRRLGVNEEDNDYYDDNEELERVRGGAEKNEEVVLNPTLSRCDIMNEDELCK